MSTGLLGGIFVLLGLLYLGVVSVLPEVTARRGSQYSRHIGEGVAATPVTPGLLGPPLLRVLGHRFRASVDYGPGFDWNTFADRQLGLALVGLGVGLAVFHFPPGLLLMVLVPGIAWGSARRQARGHRAKFVEQLPNALLLIGSAIAAGRNFANALQTTIPNLSEPIQSELGRLGVSTQMASMTDAQAFRTWADALPYQDLQTIAATLEIGQRVGLPTDVLLRSVSESMQGQLSAREELDALTSQVRTTAAVISFLPAAFIAIIYLVTPRFVQPLFTTIPGYVMIGISVVMFFISRLISQGIVARIA